METGEKQHLVCKVLKLVKYLLNYYYLLFFYADVTKIQKTRVVQALRASLHMRMRTLAKNLRLSFEVRVEL